MWYCQNLRVLSFVCVNACVRAIFILNLRSGAFQPPCCVLIEFHDFVLLTFLSFFHFFSYFIYYDYYSNHAGRFVMYCLYINDNVLTTGHHYTFILCVCVCLAVPCHASWSVFNNITTLLIQHSWFVSSLLNYYYFILLFVCYLHSFILFLRRRFSFFSFFSVSKTLILIECAARRVCSSNTQNKKINNIFTDK